MSQEWVVLVRMKYRHAWTEHMRGNWRECAIRTDLLRSPYHVQADQIGGVRLERL
jgi:hypothetical protein